MANQQQRITQEQLTQDVNFLQPFINDGTRFSIRHQATLNDILRRSARLAGRRGGPTLQMLRDLAPLLPGNANFRATDNKTTVVAGLLQMVAQLPAVVPGPNANNANANNIPNANGGNQPAQAPAAGGVPAGWEHFFDDQTTGQGVPKTLLLLKRGNEATLRHSPHKLLQLLLEEQESAKKAKELGDQAFLTYVRDNLQEMAENPNQMPPDTNPRFIWAIYFKLLQTEIDVAAKALDEDIAAADLGTQFRPVDVSSVNDIVSSDSDLESYAPNKRFAPPRYKSRKRKKKRKKKRRSRRSRSESESDTSEPSDEEPNSKRVKGAAYDGTHLERLGEFREGHKEFYLNGRVGWPSDDALNFIAKKFARPGSKFADKGNKGVKRIFGNNRAEKEHARIRTAQIYEMADEVCSLRQERNERLADAARRKEGASQAKKARIQQKARKFKHASVREEQALVSKVSVYCDLVLLGKAAWEAYHAELDLRGQQMTVIESLGGVVSRSVASKAWKAAERCAVSTRPRRPGNRTGNDDGGTQQQQGPGRRMPCYWCNKPGHLGRSCPDKLSGKPYHPKSRAASWPDHRLASVQKKKNAGNGVRVEKPNAKK